MSIHANPSREVLSRLQSQRRISALSSIAIASLAILLLGILLALVMLPRWETTPPELVTYVKPSVPEKPISTLPVPTQRPKPAAPAALASARVIVASTVAPVAFAVRESSLDFAFSGMETDDFGDSWTGAAKGGGGGFGSPDSASGGLEGILYDFKQKPDGGTISYDLANRGEFVERVVRLQRSRFSDSALRRHFQAPNRLFLTHLAVPFSNASEGPAFFGARDLIEPSGWMAHYRGSVTVPKSGTYRFSGLGDDYLAVMINGRLRLAACWSDIQNEVAGRWEPTAPTGEFMSPFHMRLVYGDWVTLRAGEKIDLDIAIGERPGGKVGFVLHIEEKGVEYRKAPDGRPILPLFATAAFSEEEKLRISSEFGSYQIEWENVPVFSTR